LLCAINYSKRCVPVPLKEGRGGTYRNTNFV